MKSRFDRHGELLLVLPTFNASCAIFDTLALQIGFTKPKKKNSKEIKPSNIKTGKNPDPETFISYKNEDPNPYKNKTFKNNRK